MQLRRAPAEKPDQFFEFVQHLCEITRGRASRKEGRQLLFRAVPLAKPREGRAEVVAQRSERMAPSVSAVRHEFLEHAEGHAFPLARMVFERSRQRRNVPKMRLLR